MLNGFDKLNPYPNIKLLPSPNEVAFKEKYYICYSSFDAESISTTLNKDRFPLSWE